MKRIFLVPAFGIALLGLGSSAHAQSSWGVNSRAQYEERQSYYDSRQAAYQNGFREGVKQGEKDGRKGDVFAYQDERTFQRADKGYSRSYGDVERYRQAFRSGYAAGYSDSYQRYAPAYGITGVMGTEMALTFRAGTGVTTRARDIPARGAATAPRSTTA